MTTTTSALSGEDVFRLQDLMLEFHHSGRDADAHLLARVHAVVHGVVFAEELTEPEDDPDLMQALEEADDDWEQGRTIPHEGVKQRLLESLRDA